MKLHCCAVLALWALLSNPQPSHAATPTPAQQRYVRALHPVEFELLRGHAEAFVQAKAGQGFSLRPGDAGTATLQLRCWGVAVLEVENSPTTLVMRLADDASQRAPDVVRLQQDFLGWLEPGWTTDDLPPAATASQTVAAGERCGIWVPSLRLTR